MEISEAYRKSRRNTSVFAGLTLAWASAQFEFSSIKLGSFGDFTLTQFSIPFVLTIIILYSLFRCTIEYMMQPLEIRRWELAKLDYNVTLTIAVTSIFLLSASGMSRSLSTVLATLGFIIILIVSFLIITFILVMIFMPINMTFQKLTPKRRVRVSAARGAIESTAYASLLSGLLLIIAIIKVGIEVFSHGLTFLGISDKPSLIPTIVFIISSIFYGIFLIKKHDFLLYVSAFKPPYKTKFTKLENGVTGVTFEENTDP